MSRTSTHDELERLRAADPLPTRSRDGSPPEVVLATIRQHVSQVPAGQAMAARGRTRRRVVAVASVTAGLLGTATVGYAVFGGGESLTIGCLTDGQVSVINATSSDPVADCVAFLDAAGETVDPRTLTTYVTGDGTVVVAPHEPTADDGVVGELSPAPDLTLSTESVELRMALDDVATGVDTCTDAEDVRQRVDAIAERLGFGDWEIVERERPDGPYCAWAFADLEEQQIVVVYDPARDPSEAPSGAVVHGPDGTPIPVPDEFLDFQEGADAGPSPYDEIVAVSQEIHDAIDADCMSAAEAERAAADAVAGTLWEDAVVLTVNPDPDAGCARVYTNAYGTYEVTIFGP